MGKSTKTSGDNPRRNKCLNEYERGKIDGLLEQHTDTLTIARIMDRSWDCINYYIHNRDTYGKLHSPGPPRKLTDRTKRHIEVLIKHKPYTLKSVQRFLESKDIARVSVPTISIFVKNLEHIKRLKMQGRLHLEKGHKLKRLEWAKQNLEEPVKWGTVIFSDEKRFNLDGPDGYRYYWHHVGRERLSYFRRPRCQKCVMVWGAISTEGKLDIIVTPMPMISEHYLGVLREGLQPFYRKHRGKKFIFMQDNTSVHTSRVTTAWLKKKNIKVLPWPANSPDINPIENVWSLFVRKVYEGQTQYHNVQDLIRAIKKAWYEIPQEVIQKLIKSVPGRLTKLIESQGGAIH